MSDVHTERFDYGLRASLRGVSRDWRKQQLLAAEFLNVAESLVYLRRAIPDARSLRLRISLRNAADNIRRDLIQTMDRPTPDVESQAVTEDLEAMDLALWPTRIYFSQT